jgi:SAM-dependent methyltransferase
MAGTDQPRGRRAGADLDRIRFRYLSHVISERWPLPSRVPTMLDISRDENVVAAGFGRLGFRVDRIRLRNISLEDLHRWLLGQTSVFDFVCCWDALQHARDWRAMLGAIARALRSGGVLCYGMSGRERKSRGLLNRLTRRWMRSSDELVSPGDLHPVLTRNGLLPQPILWLGHRRSPQATTGDQGGVVSYVGHAFRRRDVPASLVQQSWRFSTTLGRWVYGAERVGDERPLRSSAVLENKLPIKLPRRRARLGSGP